jgi:hypothetical protein
MDITFFFASSHELAIYALSCRDAASVVSSTTSIFADVTVGQIRQMPSSFAANKFFHNVIDDDETIPASEIWKLRVGKLHSSIKNSSEIPFNDKEFKTSVKRPCGVIHFYVCGSDNSLLLVMAPSHEMPMPIDNGEEFVEGIMSNDVAIELIRRSHHIRFSSLFNVSMHAILQKMREMNPSIKILQRRFNGPHFWPVFPLEEVHCSEICYSCQYHPDPGVVFTNKHRLEYMHYYVKLTNSTEENFGPIAELKERTKDAIVVSLYLAVVRVDYEDGAAENLFARLLEATQRYGDGFFYGMGMFVYEKMHSQRLSQFGFRKVTTWAL